MLFYVLVGISFLLVTKILLCGYTTLLIHSTVLVVLFPFLGGAIMHKGAKNIHIKVYVGTHVFVSLE